MAEITPVHLILDRYLARYHQARLRRTLIAGALVLAVAAALAWRFVWPLAVGSLLLGWGALLWRWQEGRLSRQGAAARLDRLLGLEQRLITAAECLEGQKTSALYPRLIADVEAKAASPQTSYPRAWSRASSALAALLVLLLCWPQAGSLPGQAARGLRRWRVLPWVELFPSDPSKAQLPRPVALDEEAGLNPFGASKDGWWKKSDAPVQEKPLEAHIPKANAADAKRLADQQEAERQARQGGLQQGANAQGRGGDEAQRATAADSSEASSEPNAVTDAAEGGQGAEAIKAEMRELLQEMSDDIKDLQVQAADTGEGAPPPDMPSDPDSLYGEATPLDPLTGAALPLPLATDTAPTQAPRRGTGVGTPSAEVDYEPPAQAPQAAALSDAPTPQAAVTRQPVPPEYRPVFERLQSTEPPQSERTP